MDELREALLNEAFLYDEPDSFIAGVDAALRAVASTVQPIDGGGMSRLQGDATPA